MKGFGQRYLAFRSTTDKVSTNNISFQTPALLDRSCTPALLDSYWVLAQLPDSDFFNTTLVCSRCTLTACGREARPNRPEGPAGTAPMEHCRPPVPHTTGRTQNEPQYERVADRTERSHDEHSSAGKPSRIDRKALGARLQGNTADRRSHKRPVGPKTSLNTNGSRIGRSGAMTSIPNWISAGGDVT